MLPPMEVTEEKGWPLKELCLIYISVSDEAAKYMKLHKRQECHPKLLSPLASIQIQDKPSISL